jgi:hypothetical protein
MSRPLDDAPPEGDPIRRKLRRMGSVFVLIGLFYVAFALLILSVLPAWFFIQGRTILAERPDIIRAFLIRPQVILGLFLILGMAAFGPVIVVSGRRLREARSHGLGMFASLLMIALVSPPVWFFGAPFGCWSLWFLTRPSVKALFKADACG